MFSDRGFSGANTHRPDFIKMIDKCRQGKFRGVLTYKLDRISRSLLDFVLLLEELDKSGVELISCTESFSSKSEMGVMIMKLLIMFAEMERKNIKSRVRDNYYSRGEKGFYLGGYPPFGYKKIPVTLYGKATSGYMISEAESLQVCRMFSDFAYGKAGVSGICSQLNLSGSKTVNGCFWSPSTVSRLLKNPFYAKADWRMYRFFQEEGLIITSALEDFDGVHGCICYGKSSSGLTGKHLTVGRHTGLIPSEIWLAVWEKFQSNRNYSSESKTRSYLSGIAVCKQCGGKLSVTGAKGITYLYCRKKKVSGCKGGHSLRSDIAEEICSKVITSRLRELAKLRKKQETSPLENQLRSQLVQVSAKINELKEKIKDVSEVTAEVFDKAICELADKKLTIAKKIKKIVENRGELCYTELIRTADDWDKLSNQNKRLIASEILETCVISDEEVEIRLK